MMSKATVLIVEDDAPHAEVVAESLRAQNFECDVATSGQQGLERLEQRPYDLVVTDLVMRDADGLDILRQARRLHPDCQVFIMTGYPDYATCMEALREGAFTYLNKPLDRGMLRAWAEKALERITLMRENVELRRALDQRYGLEGIIGNSEAIRKMIKVLPQIAQTDATLLITGESGTGKELVARAIHGNSKRRKARFVPLNCAALSESILESELFGHVKGAFTGATYNRKGRFEYAHGGTLFLDEVGDIPLSTQTKLLRAVELGEIVCVGSNEPVRVEVRVLAATNRDLEQRVREGLFRNDLYYRLRVLTVHLPPLRERVEDIPLLVDHFVREFARQHGRPVHGITKEALARLMGYSWPGNVRELRNTIESMVILARGEMLDVEDIPPHLTSAGQPAGTTAVGAADFAAAERHTARRIRDGVLHEVFEAGPNEGGMLATVEKEVIRRTLALYAGNREKTAKSLGISERTLYRKIREYGL